MSDLKPPPTVLDVLRQTRELLSSPSRWTKETFARDARGNEVSEVDPSACRWCLIGAIGRVSRDLGFEYLTFRNPTCDILDAFAPVDERDRPLLLASINDTGGRKAVLALLDRAIEAESKAAA
jgi:hypothetical protein